jgi:hypothetical protein
VTDATGSSAAGRRRRRRRRATRAEGPPRPSAAQPAVTAEPPATVPAETAPAKPARKRRAPRESSVDRGLRDLVGAGNSQLGVDGALRARDVNRPTAEELAQAERDVVIVRRHWKPAGPS